MNKYIVYAKNISLTAIVALGTGYLVPKIMQQVTDNNTAITWTTTISEYLVSGAVFAKLHAGDNKDIYFDKSGKFKIKDFVIDQVKLSGAFIILDVIYLVGKPVLMSRFIRSGVDSANASVYADGILFPTLIGLSIPLAKLSGNIRSKKSDLEKKLEE